MNPTTENILQIIAAFTAGGILGIEREYRNKPAGFRTLILICVGACLFTILSASFSTNADRIASNIVTGIGFIGAGVVFKEGINIHGITSAATIWLTAAIGMCIGLQFYILSLVVTILVLATLIILSKLEKWIDNFKQEKEYIITYFVKTYTIAELENSFKKMHINFVRHKFSKLQQQATVHYKIVTPKEVHEKLNQFLLDNPQIISFDV